MPLKQAKCFDDWCVSVMNITKQNSDRTNIYAITLQVANHARVRAQRPDHPAVYIIDEEGKIYKESYPEQVVYEKQFGIQRALESRIEAQTSYQTTMVFVLPKEQKGYIVITEGGFPTPLIIGDEGSFLHKKSITPLD